MKIYYLNRHTTCPHYIGDRPIGFSYLTATRGEERPFDPRFSVIGFLIGGEIKVTGADFETYTVKANEMFVMPSQTNHNMVAQKDVELMILYLIGERLNFCNRLFTEPIDEKTVRQLCPRHVLKMKPIVKKYLSLVETLVRDQAVCCNLHNLQQTELSAILQAYYDPKTLQAFFAPFYKSNNDFCSKVMELSKDFLSVEQMSERMCMSRSTFMREFKKHFKEAPSKWLIRVKATRLYKALKDSNEPLAQIASDLKFASQHSMNVFCLANLKGTPLEIREGKVEPPLMKK